MDICYKLTFKYSPEATEKHSFCIDVGYTKNFELLYGVSCDSFEIDKRYKNLGNAVAYMRKLASGYTVTEEHYIDKAMFLELVHLYLTTNTPIRFVTTTPLG